MSNPNIRVDSPIPQEIVDNNLVPSVEQRGKINYMKADMVHEETTWGKNPTDGQMVMARMLVDLNGIDDVKSSSTNALKVKARPAGYAIGFAEKPIMQGQDLGKNLFERGMMLFTSPINVDGVKSFVGADASGVFLIQPEEVSNPDKLSGIMREKFDKVGDQEDNCIVSTDLTNEANARVWKIDGIKIVPVNENYGRILKSASEESLRAPFISTEDVNLQRKMSNKPEEEITQTLPNESLRDVDF